MAPAASAAASSGAMRPGGLPIIRDNVAGNAGLPTYSINWSGYAAQQTTSKFNRVFSTFVQPAITCTGVKYLATSNWVGLDGFTDGTVEQDGTFAICGGKNDMTPSYAAWYEMYPAGSVEVFNVKPGDVMTSSVRYASGNYNLTIADLTSGKSYTKIAQCPSCQRNSAEWIIERPAFCGNGSCTKAVLSALPNFGTTTMTDDIASDATTKNAGINSFDSSPIAGVYNLNDQENPGSSGFTSVDTVSSVFAGPPDSFTATFNRAGQPCPITL
jgi:hypothetical protein